MLRVPDDSQCYLKQMVHPLRRYGDQNTYNFFLDREQIVHSRDDCIGVSVQQLYIIVRIECSGQVHFIPAELVEGETHGHGAASKAVMPEFFK